GEQVFSRRNSIGGNSHIQFQDPETNTIQTGFIDEIWQIPIEGHLRTFILVQKHKVLPAVLLAKTPYPSFPLFQSTGVDAAKSDRFCIIEPWHILTHLTTYRCCKRTYGIN
ncbi:hypothetical protein R3P38DRAFT_2569594, partial [Favolaschia claudopus]